MSDEMKAGGPFDEEVKSEAAAPAPEGVAPKAEETAPAAEEVKTEAVPAADTLDVDQNKPFAIIGYIIPILFFIPMLAEKKSPFGMFHAKQQLNLLIFSLVISVVWKMPFFGWSAPILGVCFIILVIIGIVGAANGEMKKLPIIGDITILQ